MNNSKNSRQYIRINNVESSETTEQSESQHVSFINYNEQYNSEYDTSDDNYVAMEEPLSTSPTAQQNMTITFGNTDCHLLPGSVHTIINMSLANNLQMLTSKMVREETTRT